MPPTAVVLLENPVHGGAWWLPSTGPQSRPLRLQSQAAVHGAAEPAAEVPEPDAERLSCATTVS